MSEKKKKKGGHSSADSYRGKMPSRSALAQERIKREVSAAADELAAGGQTDGQTPPEQLTPIVPASAGESEQRSAPPEKKRFRLNFGWIYKDKVLAVIALITSILLWVFITLNVANDSVKKMTDVPIKIDTSDIEETFGLQLIQILDPASFSAGTVDVTLHGSVYRLSKVNPEDVTVSAQVSGVNRAGESTLGLTASCSVRGVTVNIENDYSFVKVWFDRIKKKDIAIDKVVATGVTTGADDLIIGDYVSNIKSITIEGPESIVKLIDTVEIRAEVNKELSEPLEVVGTMHYLDAEGNSMGRDKRANITILDYNGIEKETGTPAGAPSPEDIKVIVPVSKTTVIPLGLSFKNVPTGFDTSTLKYSIKPKDIKLEGDIEAIDKYKEAGVYNIEGVDLSKLSPENNRFTLGLNLSTGMEELGGVTEVEVEFSMKGYSTKKLTLDSSRFRMVNVSGYANQSVLTETLSITVVGPSSVVEDISAEDCLVNIDMATYDKSEGQRKMPTSISFIDRKNVWALGSYTMMVAENDQPN